MAGVRRGVWQCPDCGFHQTWKIKSNNSNKLDRRCSSCGKRVRATIDRSSSGKGRSREVVIWERKPDTNMAILENEAKKRNENKVTETSAKQPINGEPVKQSDLPVIWGLGWAPKSPLEFVRPIKEASVRKELIRFLAERHDGYLNFVLDCWKDCEKKEHFNGKDFHDFSILFVSELRAKLSERLLEPDLLELGELEVIPLRGGSVHLARRAERFLIDVSLCLRRIAHSCSVTIGQRIQWQKWMTRTRLVDEQLKDLFTSGLLASFFAAFFSAFLDSAFSIFFFCLEYHSSIKLFISLSFLPKPSK